MINQRVFNGTIGNPSTGIGGPDAIETDIDNLLANDQELLGITNEHETQINDLDSHTTGYINLKEYGAVGNGTTDDTVAVQNFFNDFANGITGVIPKGNYKITSEIIAPTCRWASLIWNGRITAHGCNGITFNTWNTCIIDGGIEVFSNALDWNTNIFGVKFLDTQFCEIKIREINGFNKNIYLAGFDGGTSYNKLFVLKSTNGKYGAYLHSTGANGYVTENSFWGGRFGLDTNVKSTTSDSWGFYMLSEGVHGMNNNRMYSPCFEGLHNGAYLQGGDMLIEFPRFEAVDDNWISGAIMRLTVNFGFGNIDRSKIHLHSQSRNLTLIGKLTDAETTINLVGDSYTGISFLNTEDLKSLAEIKYQSYNVPHLGIKEASGVTQWLNKCYQSAGVPTSGFYRVGSIVWNSSPTVGQPIGWMCTDGGAAGTLTGVTGTGTTGTNTLTVNTATGLYIGAMIKIGTDTRTIRNITGNTIKLTTNLSTNYTDSPISYYAATFRALANLT